MRQPLTVGDPQVAHRDQLDHGLDALGDDLRAGVLNETDQSASDRAAPGLKVDALGELAVELDEVGRKVNDMGTAREPSAGVIDRQPRSGVTHAAQDDAQVRVIVDAEVLGELEHDALKADSAQQRGQLRCRDGLGSDARARPNRSSQPSPSGLSFASQPGRLSLLPPPGGHFRLVYPDATASTPLAKYRAIRITPLSQFSASL
jgi:hypothetical protein